jgi:hypothetical protein
MMGLILSLSIPVVGMLGLGLSLRTRAILLQLSSNFPAPDDLPEQGQDRQSLVLGGLVLPRGFTITSTESGLLISPGTWLRRLGTAPISVPWDAAVVESRGKKNCTIRLGEIWVSGPTYSLLGPDSESQQG